MMRGTETADVRTVEAAIACKNQLYEAASFHQALGQFLHEHNDALGAHVLRLICDDCGFARTSLFHQTQLELYKRYFSDSEVRKFLESPELSRDRLEVTEGEEALVDEARVFDAVVSCLERGAASDAGRLAAAHPNKFTIGHVTKASSEVRKKLHASLLRLSDTDLGILVSEGSADFKEFVYRECVECGRGLSESRARELSFLSLLKAECFATVARIAQGSLFAIPAVASDTATSDSFDEGSDALSASIPRSEGRGSVFHPSSAVVTHAYRENQRRSMLGGDFQTSNVGSGLLRKTDRPAFCTVDTLMPVNPSAYPLPAGQAWTDDWAVVVGSNTDSEGWTYAPNFWYFRFMAHTSKWPNDFVRTRIWQRHAVASKGATSAGHADPNNASLSSQESCSMAAVASRGFLRVFVYENERLLYLPPSGFSSKNVGFGINRAFDPPPFCDPDEQAVSLEEAVPPPGYVWCSEWEVIREPGKTDKNGWTYAYGTFHGHFSAKRSPEDRVRRRVWQRLASKK